MLHPYDALDDSAKKKIQKKIIFILFGVAILCGILIYFTRSIFPFVILFLAINIMASFIDVPLGIKKGNLIRYSPMFLTAKEKNNKSNCTVEPCLIIIFVYQAMTLQLNENKLFY